MISDSMVFHLDYLGANNQDLSASNYLRPMAEGQLLMQEVIRDGDAGYAEIKDTFIRALDCFKNKQPFYEMLLKEKLLHILILLFSYGYIRESDDSHITSENRRHIKSALEYITDHYSEKISISEMAQLAGFSENYFMSLFRQYVGMSCIQYVNHYRIQKAAHALEETTKSVSEIAMIHGFDNISYFNLQFRRTFGMTPREFRSKRK
jgi:AraC-like DNA-binding protein